MYKSLIFAASLLCLLWSTAQAQDATDIPNRMGTWGGTDAFTLYVMSAGGTNSRAGFAESNGSKSLLTRPWEKL